MRTTLFRLLAAVGILFPAPSFAAEDLKVLTDRTESTARPLFEAFEKATGTKIVAVFLEQGLLERLGSRPEEADVIITKDAELLELARTRGLLQPFKSKAIENAIPAQFRDSGDAFFVDAYRARTILYSKKRVKPGEISSYEDLSRGKWKGKLCVRSGYHDYNISLFSQMMASYGEAKTKAIIKGYHDNLAREPKGGDRDQAKGIFEGKCDVALMNSYYFPLMMRNPEQKAWAESVRLVFPDQGGGGAFIMRSALALTKSKARVKRATELLEFFAGATGQDMIVNLTFQFPTNASVKPHESLKNLGAEQAEVKDGKFKLNFVALPEFAKNRDTVVKLLNEVNFDKH